MNIFKSRLSNSIISVLSALQTQQADFMDIYFCYRLLLGRKSDREGWLHWSRRVAEGMTCDQLAKPFLESQEFHRLRNLRAKALVDVDDFLIYVDPNDPVIANSISQHKTYEPHVTSVIKKLLKPEHVFLDIGCDIGWFALLAASRLTEGKVIGIEPNHNNVQLIYHSINENHFSNVIIYPYAATDRRTFLQLSGHAAYGFVHAIEASDADYVQGVVIDELLKDETRIDIIKMDIEGHEPIALQGMREIISRHKPSIVSEFHPKLIREYAHYEPERYLDALVEMGYRLSVIQPNGELQAMGGPREVMDYWRAINQQNDTKDTTMIDILAQLSGTDRHTD